MVARASLLADVERRLGDRRLVWAGLRGDDIEPLSDLPQLYGSFAILGSYSRRSGIESLAYEALTGVRVDPEAWDIDEHPQDVTTVDFRRALLRALSGNSALLPYRPSQFLSGVYFARQRQCINLGLFAAQQAAFEHKPWVESAVADLGLPRIPWTYVADEEQLKAREFSRHGSIVLRRSRTSGGNGFAHVNSPEEVAGAWPTVDEAFVSVAPFIEGGLPMNIGATVWRDGITLHHPSVQLTGIASCVTREFGYCGNDFGLARDVDPSVLDQVEASTIAIGRWLQRHGYLGTYGVDYLVHEGQPLFTEVNPRFQGSTQSSCRLSIECGEACLMLEHVAAWLGLPAPETIPLRDRVANTPDLANIVVHWTGMEAQSLDAGRLVELVRQEEPSLRSDVRTPVKMSNESGATVARLMLRQRVTTTGFDIAGSIDRAISDWRQEMHNARAVERLV